jgi:hypothetical protein
VIKTGVSPEPYTDMLNVYRSVLADMDRPLSLGFSGTLYNISARGNPKQEILLNCNDRGMFLSLLG